MVFESLVSRHTRVEENHLVSLHKVACRREWRLDAHVSSNAGPIRPALTTVDYPRPVIVTHEVTSQADSTLPDFGTTSI